jgi:hypothetical protein
MYKIASYIPPDIINIIIQHLSAGDTKALGSCTKELRMLVKLDGHFNALKSANIYVGYIVVSTPAPYIHIILNAITDKVKYSYKSQNNLTSGRLNPKNVNVITYGYLNKSCVSWCDIHPEIRYRIIKNIGTTGTVVKLCNPKFDENEPLGFDIMVRTELP